MVHQRFLMSFGFGSDKATKSYNLILRWRLIHCVEGVAYYVE
jgi:hypothetical protein